MNENAGTRNHLSDYERAVCYYTLPRVASPLTFGLLVAYGVCLLEAVSALAYGLVTDEEVWSKWGAISLAGIILLGIAIFTLRAIVNEIRQRRTLSFAEGYPDASSKAGDIPDPFEGHTLLRYPRHAAGGPLLITDNGGAVKYTVQRLGRRAWEVFDAEGESSIRVEGRHSGRSFVIGGSSPARVNVYRGDRPVALVERRFSLRTPRVVITTIGDTLPVVTARAGGLFRNDVLIGRVYTVRGFVYLDLQKDCFSDGILGFFVGMV